MTERQPRPEISEQYLTDLAYFRFINLAVTYGTSPKVEYDYPVHEEYEAALQNGKALRVEIPADSPSENFVLTGKDYGSGSRTVEVYYEKGDKATKFILIKGKKTNSVHVAQPIFFHINFDNINPKNKGFTPISDRKVKVNMLEVNDVLKTAEAFLEIRHKEEILANIEKKVKVRKRASHLPFAQRVQVALEHVVNKLPQA